MGKQEDFREYLGRQVPKGRESSFVLRNMLLDGSTLGLKQSQRRLKLLYFLVYFE